MHSTKLKTASNQIPELILFVSLKVLAVESGGWGYFRHGRKGGTNKFIAGSTLACVF